MFCSKCGEQIPDGVAFCPKCGTPVGGGDSPVMKKKFSGSKVYLIMVIAMFLSALTENWVAMAVLFAIELFFVKDKWLLRNSVQPFGVGMVLVLWSFVTELLSGTAIVNFTGARNVLLIILTYTREAVVFAGIVLLIVGFVTLFSGETKVPLFTKLGEIFKDEEEKEA